MSVESLLLTPLPAWLAGWHRGLQIPSNQIPLNTCPYIVGEAGDMARAGNHGAKIRTICDMVKGFRENFWPFGGKSVFLQTNYD